MAKDLRTYLNQLERTCPDELMRVPGKISSHLEATTFLRKLELEGKAPMTAQRLRERLSTYIQCLFDPEKVLRRSGHGYGGL